MARPTPKPPPHPKHPDLDYTALKSTSTELLSQSSYAFSTTLKEAIQQREAKKIKNPLMDVLAKVPQHELNNRANVSVRLVGTGFGSEGIGDGRVWWCTEKDTVLVYVWVKKKDEGSRSVRDCGMKDYNMRDNGIKKIAKTAPTSTTMEVPKNRERYLRRISRTKKLLSEDGVSSSDAQSATKFTSTTPEVYKDGDQHIKKRSRATKPLAGNGIYCSTAQSVSAKEKSLEPTNNKNRKSAYNPLFFSTSSDLESQTFQQDNGRIYSALFRPCILLGALLVSAFSTSLVLALWRSIAHDDISGGFTLGGYIVTVTGLPTSLVNWKHWKSCRCWRKEKVEDEVDEG